MLEGLEHLRRIERQLTRALGRDTMSALHDALTQLHDHLES